ncbi:hypothetical protein MHU86_15640 [Fragilaria crotonensis]|nr:hypothetical protein MHU86_15640 [Fragilaria crotonensis]
MPVMQMPTSSKPTAFEDPERCPSPEMLKTGITHSVKTKPQPTTKPRRGVSFNKSVFVRETLHKADYTIEERENTWLQKDEMAQIKADMVATVRLFSRGVLAEDTSEHCSRGLEFRSREGAYRRKINKFRALEAVLDQQDEQFDTGIFNEKAISMIYQSVSLRCRKEAHDRGICDAIEVYGRILSPIIQSDNLSEKVRSSRRRLHQVLKRSVSKQKDKLINTDV